MPVRNLTPWWHEGLVGPPQSTSLGYSQQFSGGTNMGTSTQRSTTYIPEYSQTAILEAIAKQAQQMAPDVYKWGMDQYNKNQGNIDAMIRDARTYASPARIKQEMGQAQARVMQGAEAGRQSAERDLQGYGIDPSSGRYAALDKASRVATGAAAAGAGNQQRMATEAAGGAMLNQGLSASMQNMQTGYGAAGAANQLLGTGMSLKYSPLGNVSTGDSLTAGSNVGGGYNVTGSQSGPVGGLGSMTGKSIPTPPWGGNLPGPGNTWVPPGGTQQPGGGPSYPPGGIYGGTQSPGSITTGTLVNPTGGGFTGGGGLTGGQQHPTGSPTNPNLGPGGSYGGVMYLDEGGHVPDELSTSDGATPDDVPANLTAGEFIIPKDVVEWKGKEFFYGLMAKARKLRATSGNGMGYGDN